MISFQSDTSPSPELSELSGCEAVCGIRLPLGDTEMLSPQ